MSEDQVRKSCDWCGGDLPARARSDSRFCGRRCRQAAWRVRGMSLVDHRRLPSSATIATPLRFAYADPPYPGTAKKYYGAQRSYDGEVDHRALLEQLMTGGFDGWALSTSAKELRHVLPLCPPEARVCAWAKPHPVPPATYGLHNVWEPVVVLQGRRIRPGRPDALCRYPARLGGDLPGRKPLAFCAWLFDAMGMLPGDLLLDLFPGTGIVGRAWRELSSSDDRRRLARV